MRQTKDEEERRNEDNERNNKGKKEDNERNNREKKEDAERKEKTNSDKLELVQDMWKQLKQVSTLVFNGDKKPYQSWKTAFMTCIDQAPTITEYKLLQLRSRSPTACQAAWRKEKTNSNKLRRAGAIPPNSEKINKGTRRSLGKKAQNVKNSIRFGDALNSSH